MYASWPKRKSAILLYSGMFKHQRHENDQVGYSFPVRSSPLPRYRYPKPNSYRVTSKYVLRKSVIDLPRWSCRRPFKHDIRTVIPTISTRFLPCNICLRLIIVFFFFLIYFKYNSLAHDHPRENAASF